MGEFLIPRRVFNGTNHDLLLHVPEHIAHAPCVSIMITRSATCVPLRGQRRAGVVQK